MPPIDQTIWQADPWSDAFRGSQHHRKGGDFHPCFFFHAHLILQYLQHHLIWRHWKYSTKADALALLVDCLQIHQPCPHHAPRSVASTHYGWDPSWGQINQQKAEVTQVLLNQGKALPPENLFMVCQLWLLCRYWALFLALLLKKHIGLVSPHFTQLHGTMKKENVSLMVLCLWGHLVLFNLIEPSLLNFRDIQIVFPCPFFYIYCDPTTRMFASKIQDTQD